MNCLKKTLILLVVSYISMPNNSSANNNGKYPNISGNALFEVRADRVLSTDKQGIQANSAIINIEPSISLNLDQNWSVKTNWRIAPIAKRNNVHPERFRTILSNNRGANLSDQGLIVEQLKGEFENEDLKFFFGKFNPIFGTAWKREKGIGVFTADFTRDYELREKIGLGATALLEESEITFSTFFNDNSELGNSAIRKRGEESSSSNLAGNTSTLSSYAATMNGKNLFDAEDIFYNFGYSNLEVNNVVGRNAQQGYVGGIEYLISLGSSTSIVPFIEIAKINNLSGESDRDALYMTTALVGKYNNWTTSVSSVLRQIKQKNNSGKVADRQFQYSIGYKFTNNVAIGVSRMLLKEDGYNAQMFGALLSYIYEF